MISLESNRAKIGEQNKPVTGTLSSPGSSTSTISFPASDEMIRASLAFSFCNRAASAAA